MLPLPRRRVGRSCSSRGAECVHVGGAAHGGRLYRENLRGHLRFLAKHRGAREAERARRLLLVALRLRARLFRGERGATTARPPAGSRPATCATLLASDERQSCFTSGSRRGHRGRARAGLALARALGVRGVVGDARVVARRSSSPRSALTFAVEGSLALTLVLLAVAARSRPASAVFRAPPGAEGAAPLALGSRASEARLLGILLWQRRGHGPGRRPLPPRARPQARGARRALARRGRRVRRTAACIPGYAFPLWHGVPRAHRAGSPASTRRRSSSTCRPCSRPLAVVVAYEAGWALFRTAWAAGAVAGAARRARLLRARARRRVHAARAARDVVPSLLVAGRARARARRRSGRHSRDAARVGGGGRARARGRPPHLRDLPLDPVRGLPVRALRSGRARTCAPGRSCSARSLCPPRCSCSGSSRSSATRRPSSPDAEEVQRALEQYAGPARRALGDELQPRAGGLHPARARSRSPRSCSIPLAAFAARRRWAAFVVGGSLAVFAVMLVPLLFTPLADFVSISQARRAAGFLPFAFAFAGGLGVLSRMLGPLRSRSRSLAGHRASSSLYPGDFDYALDDGGPALDRLVRGRRRGRRRSSSGFVRGGRRRSSGRGARRRAVPRCRSSRSGSRTGDAGADARRQPALAPGSSRPCATRCPAPRSSTPIRRRATGSPRRARLHRGRAARARRGHDRRTGPFERARDARRVPPHRRPLDPRGATAREYARRRPAARDRALELDLDRALSATRASRSTGCLASP